MEIIDLECNELQFFSLWSKQWTTENLILLYNPIFSDDPLFNHALLKDMEVVLTQDDLRYVKSFYERLKVRPALFLLEKKYQELLLESDFEVLDKLLTMSTGTRSCAPSNPSIKISICSKDDLEDWVKVFVDAFAAYSWVDGLKEITPNLLKHPGCTLYIARYKSKAVGVAARFSSEKLSGIYCLGTIPDLRGRGIGSTLIKHLINEAYKEGDRNLCLQTLLSENLIRFYTKLGFKKVYRKVIYIA
ncbi:MAG: GNAT family N-acetyltransferase [Nitrososphaerales archaeon]